MRNNHENYHWWKFEYWFQDVVVHDDYDKLKLLKKFIAACQFLKKDFNQFYLKLFNLEIQSECIVSTKNYCTRLLKSLQNLMNQHDHEYSIIQHVVTHTGKLWQTLDREKICQELKKEKNKAQNYYKNFNQHCQDDF